jgi:hypothetical protein
VIQRILWIVIGASFLGLAIAAAADDRLDDWARVTWAVLEVIIGLAALAHAVATGRATVTRTPPPPSDDRA